jgi:site-specific DNA recombinase
VGDIKKGKYVYYRCSGAKGKCLESYTREEVFGEKFAALLKGISCDQETVTLVRRTQLESHYDEKQLHADAAGKRQREHRRLQDRLERMYEDKLDGQIDNDYYNRKAAEYRSEQARIMRQIQAHGTANQSYIEDGARLLELAQQAYVQFEKQPPARNRRLLGFVLSNCSWKGGELTVEYHHPFELLAVAVASEQQRGERESRSPEGGRLFFRWKSLKNLAPQVGLEPTTLRLTARLLFPENKGFTLAFSDLPLK